MCAQRRRDDASLCSCDCVGVVRVAEVISCVCTVRTITAGTSDEATKEPVLKGERERGGREEGARERSV